jgi:hypothetical protein
MLVEVVAVRYLRGKNPVDFNSTLIRRHHLEVSSSCFKSYYVIVELNIFCNLKPF